MTDFVVSGAMQGARAGASGKALLEQWLTWHRNAQAWLDIPLGSRQASDRNFLDQCAQDILTYFKISSDEAWNQLCRGVGWTVYGAVALSWCKGADLDQVWAGWLASGFPLKPLPEYERPARFINPALLPDKTTAEGINQWSVDQNHPNEETHQLAVCAVISALKKPLEFGLPPEKYSTAAPQIAAFLKSRLLQKPALTAQENELIAVFDKKISGTEWDVWQGAR